MHGAEIRHEPIMASDPESIHGLGRCGLMVIRVVLTLVRETGPHLRIGAGSVLWWKLIHANAGR